MTKLKVLEKRLANLRKYLDEEPDKEGLYAGDLRDLIVKIEDEIKQLEYANNNPYVMVNGGLNA